MQKIEYLKSNIFVGLKNLNNGFDTSSIFYFSVLDFETLLDRIENKGIGLYGIEPWLNGCYYDVLSYEEFNTNPFDSKWYRAAFSKFKSMNEDLVYSASYEIPESLLNV